jgi:hypothetical protein
MGLADAIVSPVLKSLPSFRDKASFHAQAGYFGFFSLPPQTRPPQPLNSTGSAVRAVQGVVGAVLLCFEVLALPGLVLG